MTIPMPDSITPGNLPPGYPAYLGYSDGRWPTAAELRAKFPGAHVLSLTVTGATLDADGIDCEPGNPDAVTAARWAVQKMHAAPSERPVVYADLESPGYSMTEVRTALISVGAAPRLVRMLTAHYTGKPHICGPGSCGALPFDADGTQWTDQFAGLDGSRIDMSALNDGFFGAPAPVPSPTVEVNVQLDILRQGSTGQAVRNWQGILVAHGYGYLLGGGGTSVESRAGVDGVFGGNTHDATALFQQGRHLAADGIVGAQTWAAALNVG